MNPQRYPIGIQTFSKIREEGYLYVDKTDLVYQIANGNSNYVFLSRPRRFGKTLLVSTQEELNGMPITKVALNFDPETRNISEWLVE